MLTQTQIEKLRSYRPQVAEITFGREPSLGNILLAYYLQGGIPLAEALQLVDAYFKQIGENI